MNKFSYDAVWANLASMARANANVLAILAGVFLLLPNFAQLLFAPPPNIRSLDWNGVRQMQTYISENALALILCNLPVWLGSAGVLALLLDPRRLTVGEALASAGRLLPGVVLLNWLTEVIVISGLVLFVIPGLYLIGRLMLAAPVQMAERVWNPFTAIGRSFALSRGNGWRTTGLVLLIAVVVTIAGAATNLVLGVIIALVLPAAVAGVVAALVRSAVMAATALTLLLLSAALYRQVAPVA